jgi:hypothetical protein
MKLDERIEAFKRTPAPDLWPDIERRQPVAGPTPGASGWRRLGIAAAALAIGAAAVILVERTYPRHVDTAQPTKPTAANGVIAYAPIGEQHVFWTMSPDGSRETKVRVDVPGFVSVPSWSPHGSKIAFAVNSYDDPHPEGGYWDIYVANADGSSPQRLTNDRVDHSPAWSPDGTRIAYVNGYGDDQQIRVMNADGSDVRELTSDHGLHIFPTWSPDGSQIAYVAFDGTNANIYVMNADGSGSHQVTDDPAHEDAPAWSPDGRLIAFTSEGGTRDPGIYTMSPDGTGVTQWAHDPDPANLGIAWSPDGTKLALVSIRGPGYDRNVYVLDVASREVTTIGQPGAYFGVSWQPVSATTTSEDDVRDPAPLPHETFRVDGTAGSVATGDGWVWVATNDAERQGAILDRINPSAGNVTSSIPLPGHPEFLAAGQGSVWAPVLLDGGDPVMLQIDAATGEVVDRFRGLSGPVVAASDGTVWAVQVGTDGPSEIVHLVAGSLTDRVSVAAPPFDMVEAAGSIWVLFLPSDPGPELDADLIRIDEGTGSVLARLDVRSGAIWLAGNEQGVWLSSGLPEQRGSSVFVSASDNTVTPFGNIYNFRPFAVADGHVWFIAGPHDGPIQGTCGLNLETQIADVCGNDGEGPDLEDARDPGAYEPTTNTIWTGVYLKAEVTRVELGP